MAMLDVNRLRFAREPGPVKFPSIELSPLGSLGVPLKEHDSFKSFSTDLANERLEIDRTFRRGEITEAERNALFTRLDALANTARVDKFDGEKGLTPDALAGYRRSLGAIEAVRQTKAMDPSIDGAKRADHLGRWIDALGQEGLLTVGEGSEVADLHSELSALRERQPPATQADYSALEQKIHRLLSDNSIDEGSLRASLDKRQARGAADGSLTTEEQAKLNSAYRELEQLTGEHRATKLKDIDGLIYQLRHNSSIDPVARRMVLDASIKASELSAGEKASLQAELAGYTESELNDFGARLRALNVLIKP